MTGEVGGRPGVGKGRMQKRAATSPCTTFVQMGKGTSFPKYCHLLEKLPDMQILFDQDLLSPSAGKPIAMTTYTSPHVEGWWDLRHGTAGGHTYPQEPRGRGAREGASAGGKKGCCVCPL